MLAACYRNSLLLAKQYSIKTIAFPAISTGAFGYPMEEAAQIALSIVQKFTDEYPDAFEEIRFVLFSNEALHAYREVWEEIRSG